MLNFKTVNRDQVKQTGAFQILPKGAYVVKIINIKVENNKKENGQHLRMAFDIAEGEYKDFYMKQYQSNTNEDKKWPNDANFVVTIPDDNSPEWMTQRFFTFLANVEDSNPGYTFNGDETKLKGKLVGGLFRNEQSEYNGNIYEHTKLHWTRPADDIRNNRYGSLPKDKTVTASAPVAPGSASNEFINIPDAVGEDEIPF